jgi:hypothetical protein
MTILSPVSRRLSTNSFNSHELSKILTLLFTFVNPRLFEVKCLTLVERGNNILLHQFRLFTGVVFAGE